MTRVLVVSDDVVGTNMAGPAVRAHRLASELAARGFDVVLSTPNVTDISATDLEIVQTDPWDARAMTRRVRGFDAIIARRLPVPTLLALRGSETRTIFDLYAPLAIENLAHDREARAHRPREEAYFQLNRATDRVVFESGSAFICASERQRDLWLGALLSAGRINHDTYRRDPTLRQVIDVVPFGIDVSRPPVSKQVLRGVVPGIGEHDRIVLWNGGIWNWFDPLTVIHAAALLAERRDDIRLVFLGLSHPNPNVPEMRMAARAKSLAEELGLCNRIVFFNEGWVSYEERGAWLQEADLGITAHLDSLEARFSFRTRLLDCFWAGLPVVATQGDELADLVERRGLGSTVPPGDAAACAEAVQRLLDDEAERRRITGRLRAVREELSWSRVVEPLVRLIGDASSPSGPRLTTQAGYASARLRHALLAHGIAGAARRLVTRIRS